METQIKVRATTRKWPEYLLPPKHVVQRVERRKLLEPTDFEEFRFELVQVGEPRPTRSANSADACAAR